MSWREFWNGTHSIYVNERHRVLHYDRIAKDIAALVPARDAAVLDYGCGEAEASETIATRCAMLYLYDAAPKVQERLRQRFGSEYRRVVEETGSRTRAEAELCRARRGPRGSVRRST